MRSKSVLKYFFFSGGGFRSLIRLYPVGLLGKRCREEQRNLVKFLKEEGKRRAESSFSVLFAWEWPRTFSTVKG